MWNDTPQTWQPSMSIANSETLYFCIHPRRAPSKNPAENPPPSGIESLRTVCDFFHHSSTSSPSNFPSSFYFQAFDVTKLGERLWKQSFNSEQSTPSVPSWNSPRPMVWSHRLWFCPSGHQCNPCFSQSASPWIQLQSKLQKLYQLYGTPSQSNIPWLHKQAHHVKRERMTNSKTNKEHVSKSPEMDQANTRILYDAPPPNPMLPKAFLFLSMNCWTMSKGSFLSAILS